MSKKYIRENKNSYAIVKNSKTYIKVNYLDDAIFLRDLLIKYDWNLNQIPQIVFYNDNYLVLVVIEDKLHLLAKYKSEPSAETVEKLIKKHKRNPNNSKYGLNISKVFDTFVIQKRIFGDDYIFGYYDKLEDAEFVRNFLIDNGWNVRKFSEVEFDDETDTYKVVSVIDDNVYVLDSFKTNEINLNNVYEDFLSKISKHKYGLANYPHLNFLTEKISELELKYGVKTTDDIWALDGDISSPLNDIVFNLTPFQQSVFDAISDKTTLDEVKRVLIRYKSKNFDKKIIKNIDELIDLKLIEKIGENTYRRI